MDETASIETERGDIVVAANSDDKEAKPANEGAKLDLENNDETCEITLLVTGGAINTFL